MTLGGRPSAVVSVVYVVHLTGGAEFRRYRRVEPPVMYETLTDEVRSLNAMLAAERKGRR